MITKAPKYTAPASSPKPSPADKIVPNDQTYKVDAKGEHACGTPEFAWV